MNKSIENPYESPSTEVFDFEDHETSGLSSSGPLKIRGLLLLVLLGLYLFGGSEYSLFPISLQLMELIDHIRVIHVRESFFYSALATGIYLLVTCLACFGKLKIGRLLVVLFFLGLIAQELFVFWHGIERKTFTDQVFLGAILLTYSCIALYFVFSSRVKETLVYGLFSKRDDVDTCSAVDGTLLFPLFYQIANIIGAVMFCSFIGYAIWEGKLKFEFRPVLMLAFFSTAFVIEIMGCYLIVSRNSFTRLYMVFSSLLLLSAFSFLLYLLIENTPLFIKFRINGSIDFKVIQLTKLNFWSMQLLSRFGFALFCVPYFLFAKRVRATFEINKKINESAKEAWRY